MIPESSKPKFSNNPPSLKTFGFGMHAFKKYPELIPLASILTTACFGATMFVLYSLATKPDVRVFKSSDLPPWERVQPTEARKLRVVNRKVYKPIPELEELKQEIGSYRP
ncbi:normal mucosa of esophagus-specific gene 1 protein-like isoform X1 [Babylonia areolata]|uniref:normal mucosa of esophagus-specific gene 1 protein-like isoform X1 n=1 Tax=Babylonia areolata TaxID=304850 RepID=UPI003FD5752F